MKTINLKKKIKKKKPLSTHPHTCFEASSIWIFCFNCPFISRWVKHFVFNLSTKLSLSLKSKNSNLTTYPLQFRVLWILWFCGSKYLEFMNLGILIRLKMEERLERERKSLRAISAL